MNIIAHHLRSRINKMSHAAGQKGAERLKHEWTTSLERMLDEGAGYDDLVQFLDALAASQSGIEHETK